MVSFVEVIAVSVLAGAATGLGALPLYVVASPSVRTYDTVLGFASGVMLGAVAFALVAPALDGGATVAVAGATLLGGLSFLFATRATPGIRRRFEGLRSALGTGAVADDRRQAIVLAAAVTVDNAPEGLAVGIAFGSGLDGVGFALAAAIALQNLPDGFLMAVSATRSGIPRSRAVRLALASGAVPEPVAAGFGYLLVERATGLFPVAAGFAAGAILVVVTRELLPSAQSHEYGDAAVAALVLGFVVTAVLEGTLAA